MLGDLYTKVKFLALRNIEFVESIIPDVTMFVQHLRILVRQNTFFMQAFDLAFTVRLTVDPLISPHRPVNHAFFSTDSLYHRP